MSREATLRVAGSVISLLAEALGVESQGPHGVYVRIGSPLSASLSRRECQHAQSLAARF